MVRRSGKRDMQTPYFPLPGFEPTGTRGTKPLHPTIPEDHKAIVAPKNPKHEQLVAKREKERETKLTAFRVLTKTYGVLASFKENRWQHNLPDNASDYMKEIGSHFKYRSKDGYWDPKRISVKTAEKLISDCTEILTGLGWNQDEISRLLRSPNKWVKYK